MSNLIEQNIFRHDDLRQRIDHRLRDVQLLPQSNNHTHQKAAALRTSANIALVELAEQAGFRPYVVSYSTSDHNMGLAGCRNFYWSKDLSIPHRDDAVESGDCFVMVDVDFHLDMNEYLKKFKPILMFTFCPKKVCHNDQVNGHSYMIADNVVYYEVMGGSNYTHRLWEYTGDTISKIDDNGSLLTYDLTQKEVEGYPDRRIITILPRTCTPWPYYTAIHYDDGIRYLQITQPSNMINILYNPLTDMASVSMNYSHQSVELKSRLLLALIHRISQKKTTSPEIGDIETILVHESALEQAAVKKVEDYNSNPANKKKKRLPIRQDCLENCKVSAALLHQIIPWIWHIPFNLTPTVALRTTPLTFNALGPITMKDEKTPCVGITTPLVSNPSTVPVRSLNNQMAAVKGRVTKYCNTVIPSKQYKNYAAEFVRLLVPLEETVVPFDHSVIIEIQNKPTQKARTKLVFDTLGTEANNALKSFIKGEGYESMNDPRVITQMKPELTINMSRFTYAFKYQILKSQSWYAPGKTPVDICNRINAISRQGLIDTDYSRFDGSISNFLQYKVVLPSYMRAIVSTERASFLKLFDSVFKQKGVTEGGLIYDTCYGTRSGSPITTDGNTMINAYIGYCALRDIGAKPDDAWSRLGIYGGDDGLTSREPYVAASIEKVAGDLGLSVKMCEHETDAPVPFLGRIFPRPMTSISSHQDITRTLPKLHLSFNKNVSLNQAAYNKAFGYMATDAKTPILREWANVVMKSSGCTKVVNARADEEYKATLSWPQEDEDLIGESVARQLNCTIPELTIKCNQISVVDGEFPLAMPVVYDNQINHKLDGKVGDVVISNSGNRVINTQDFDLKCPKTHENCRKHSMSGVLPEVSTSNSPSSNTSKSEQHGSKKALQTPKSTQPQSENCANSSLASCSTTESQNQSSNLEHNLAKSPEHILLEKKNVRAEKRRKPLKRATKRPKKNRSSESYATTSQKAEKSQSRASPKPTREQMSKAPQANKV